MKPTGARSKMLAVVLLAGVLPLLVTLAAPAVFGVGKHVQEPVHEFFELAGSCIALSVAMLLLLRLRHETASPHLMWVVAALVAMAIVDSVHSLIPFGVAFSWTRHGATLVGGVLFALVWLPLPDVVVRRKQYLISLVAVLAIAGSFATLWWSDRLPAPWVAGNYSRSVIAANGLGGLGFLASALFFIRRYLREPQPEDLVFASQTLLFSAASLFFGFSHVWAADWWVWHGARLLAYGVVLVVAWRMVGALYRQLGEHAQELEGHVQARTAELLKANDVLQTEIVQRQRAEADVQQRSEEQARLNAELKRSNRATYNLMQDAVLTKDQLRETNEYLENLFNHANAPIIVWNPQFRITRFNHAFETLTGRPARDVIGKVLEILFPPALAESSMALIKKTSEGERWETVEIPILHLDGSVRTVLWNSATIFAVDEKTPVATIAQGQDLTERKQSEAALSEVQNLRTEAEKLGKVGGWEFDTETAALTWTEEVYHIHEVDLTYQPTVDAGINFFAPASRPIIEQAVQRAIEQGEPYDLELEIITAKGNRRHVHSIGRADPIRGKVLGFFQDITAQKHAEEELRNLNAQLDQRVRERTAQLEAANKELEAFSYSVSHDLRAPLRAIDGFGRILVENYEGRLDQEGRRVLGVISSETRRMGHLVDDLLAFSRLGRQNLESSCIDMTAMAQAVFKEQAAHAPTRVFQLDVKPLPPAHGDRAMIRVVLGNLVSNAIKFTAPRNPAVIEIGSRQEGGQAVYYVKDNGVGFDIKYADKLFGVFQRLHSAEEFEGTGVGLALVQRVVHRHGGRVWAEGKVNDGATFSFSLPDMREHHE